MYESILSDLNSTSSLKVKNQSTEGTDAAYHYLSRLFYTLPGRYTFYVHLISKIDVNAEVKIKPWRQRRQVSGQIVIL